MKKAKKLVALFLAMAMAFSLMAVTAAAYSAEEHEHTSACSEETIQPRVPCPQCTKCCIGMNRVGTHTTNKIPYVDFECPNCGATESVQWPQV